MPKGYPNPKPELPPVEVYDAFSPRALPLPSQEGPRLARVRLERNYRPAGDYKVIGHTRPEIKRKDPTGNLVIFQREEFIPDEAMPAAIAGTGFADKLWAGTVIEVVEDEAKTIVKQKIGSLEFAD